MTDVACPSCHALLSVTHVDGSDEPVLVRVTRVSTPDATDAVGALVEGLEGRFTVAQLRGAYEQRREAEGWPALSAKAFGRALRALGKAPWRSSGERGWVL